MRFGVLIGVIAALAAAQAAHSDGLIHGPLAVTALPPPPGACGGWASTTFDDGCAGAPPASAYTIQHPDFFSGYAQQSGQTYVSTGGCKGHANCHPPWAVAGVDYPVGVSTVGTGFASPSSATDPTNSSSPNYGNGNPAHCARGGINLIVCPGPTSQEVDIGPFDFSWQGNATGHGMGLTIGSGVTGPCVIHDSYFVFDLGVTSVSRAYGGYNIGGCSSLTIKNSVFRIRDPSTGAMDAMWDSRNPNLFIFVGAGPRAHLNNPLNLEYNAFIHCPSRCLTTGAFNASHNYFEGFNIYGPTGFAAHGDGWMTSFYNNAPGPPSGYVCACSGLSSLVEKFDTWLSPATGAGESSCFTCAIVNQPAGSLIGDIKAGSNILHVSAIHMFAMLINPSVGMPINGTHAYNAYTQPHPPSPVPRIASCPASGCGTLGDYTLNVPWTASCTGAGCGFGLIYQANVDTADYENNVWVTNIVNASGAAPGYSGPGNPSVQSIWWAGYGVYSHVYVKNNYADICGVYLASISKARRSDRDDGRGSGQRRGPSADQTEGPNYRCAPPMTTVPPGFGGASPETSLAEGGNVMMNNGRCFSIWTRQTSC
jgi:hypothetical protein